MNKSELKAAVVAATEVEKDTVSTVVDSTFDTIVSEVAGGNDVNIAGFGNFSRKERSERKGRNPQTGEEIIIAASKAVGFKPLKVFKDAVNK